MRDTVGKFLIALGAKVMQSDPPRANVVHVKVDYDVKGFAEAMRRAKGGLA